MTEQNENPKQKKRAFDFFDKITKRIGKIKALVVIVGALVVAVLTYARQITTILKDMGIYTPPPCVEVVEVVIPPTIKYSEWEHMKITLKGRNNCSNQIGLYVSFLPQASSERRIVLRGPHEDYAECRLIASSREPKCWDPKKPIITGKGKWEWNVPPPHLEKLADPLPIEKISFNWYVYDFDAPDKPAIQTGTAIIEVQNDTTKTP
jgi:hypothetical protein